MKLKRITLNNFRSHSETSLDLSPGVTLVTGPVGAGKTSIVAGIAACLTGRNAMTDGRGIGLDQQIMDGTDRLALSLEFDDGIKITRTRERGGASQLLTNLPGMAGQKSQAMQMALMLRLGISEETLLALLDTRQFAALEKATQKNILLALARPQALALDGAMLRAASELLSREVRPESLEEVRALYSEIYSLRTVLNRQKAGLPSPAKPDMTDVPSLAKVQTDYRAAIQQNQVLTAEVSRLEQLVSQATAQIEASKQFASAEDVTFAETNLKTLQAAHEPLKTLVDAARERYEYCRDFGIADCSPEAVAGSEALKLLAAAQEKVKAATAEHERMRAAQADALAEMRKWIDRVHEQTAEQKVITELDGKLLAVDHARADMLESIAQIEGRAQLTICPTCGQPRRELLPEDFKALDEAKARLQTIDAEKLRVEAELKAATETWAVAYNARLDELKKAFDEADRAMLDAGKLVDDAKNEVTRIGKLRTAELRDLYDKAVEASASAAEAVREAEKELNRVKRERKAAEKLDALREQTAADETRLPLAREELLACQRKIARIEEVQTEVQRLTDQQVAWENASAQHQRLAGQIASCETLVEYFGPSGVQAAQLTGGDFEDGVSKLLEQAGMPGRFELKNNSAKTGDITLTVAGRPVQNLSEGEQFLFEFGFRAAAALRSGFPVVCLDGANRVDGKRMRALVRAAAASGVQVIVTTLEVPTETPQGIEIVRVDNPHGVSLVHTAARTTYAEASN